MKKLLRNSILFIIPAIAFMYLADYFFTNQLRKARYDEFGIWNDIFDGKIDSDVAVYGSSRAMVHMDTEILRDSLGANAYNMGVNGHNFWITYLRHLEYLKYNRQPRMIIQSIDVFTLTKRPDLFNPDQFLPYMRGNDLMKDFISSYKGFGKYDYYLPLIRYTGQYKTILDIFKNMVKPGSVKGERIRGYSPQDQAWNDDMDVAFQKFDNFRVDFDTASVVLFDRFLQECKDKNIEVVLVYTPEFIEGQDFVKNRTEILNKFKEFAEKYNLRYFDYSNDPISHNRDYFYNASHLNREGASVFTRKLSSDIIRTGGLK
jgi:hypothetical protein